MRTDQRVSGRNNAGGAGITVAPRYRAHAVGAAAAPVLAGNGVIAVGKCIDAVSSHRISRAAAYKRIAAGNNAGDARASIAPSNGTFPITRTATPSIAVNDVITVGQCYHASKAYSIASGQSAVC